MPEVIVSQHDLASWLDLSPRRIRELTASQVLTKNTKGYALKASVRAYLSFLRSKTGSLTDERARLTRAQADLQELKLREKTGELVLRAAVEKMQFAQYRQVRDGLQTIPARLSGIVAAESDQRNVFDLLSKEILHTLEGLVAHGLQTDRVADSPAERRLVAGGRGADARADARRVGCRRKQD